MCASLDADPEEAKQVWITHHQRKWVLVEDCITFTLQSHSIDGRALSFSTFSQWSYAWICLIIALLWENDNADFQSCGTSVYVDGYLVWEKQGVAEEYISAALVFVPVNNYGFFRMKIRETVWLYLREPLEHKSQVRRHWKGGVNERHWWWMKKRNDKAITAWNAMVQYIVNPSWTRRSNRPSSCPEWMPEKGRP